MTRRRHLVVAVVAALTATLTACSVGPQAFLVTVPFSGSSSGLLWDYVQISASFPSAAEGLKIEFDATGGAAPGYVAYEVTYAYYDGPLTGRLTGPDGFHFEHVFDHSFKPGEGVYVVLRTGCDSACPAWHTSSKTFTYRLSPVP